MKKYLINSILLLFPLLLFSQQTLRGMLMDRNNPKDNLGVYGVNVRWLNTKIGSTTDEKGWFSIPYKSSYKKLIVSYIGYRTDTLSITNLVPVHHFLTEETATTEVVIRSKKRATQKSFFCNLQCFYSKFR